MRGAATFEAPEGLHACVHCGLCLQACPTYLELGSEADSPRGRIQLMEGLESGRLGPSDEVRGHLDACLGCRACETACPSGVPYGTLIEAARPFLERTRQGRARVLRRALVAALAGPQAPALLRLLRRLPGLAPLARRAPGMWMAYLAALPAPEPRGSLPPVLEPEGRARGTAVLVTGCIADALYPATNRAAARLLVRAGARVVVLGGRCCGALFAHAGLGREAHARERALAAAIPAGADWVVTTAAGCGAHLRTADARARDALALVAELGLPPAERAVARRVAVHDPCHLVHGQGVRDEVRTLLAAIPALELTELAESDVCCGSAGTYNLTERGMAARLLARKLGNVERSGANVVAAANPGCLLQIRAGVLKRGLTVAVEHPLDLLARAHLP